jgi:regulator of replication initiation timing
VNEDRIFDKLDELGEKQTATLVAIAAMQEQLKDVPDHESRIRSLERWRWSLVGGLGLLSTAFTAYGTSRGA